MSDRDSKIKKRLDIFLVENKLVPNRSRARGEIMAGNVYVDGVKQDKPGLFVSAGSRVEVRGKPNPYVSRGGLKLEKALQVFPVSLKGKTVLDIGASTGGFTHCALKQGARKVIALDVGYGQLAWQLRNHPDVVTLERFNVRHLKKEDLPFLPQLATVDVSFISLELVLPALFSLGVEKIIALVKPQFEASPARVGKKGVVRDIAVHHGVLRKVIRISLYYNYTVEGLTYSPLKGPQGNIEYLLYLERDKSPGRSKEQDELTVSTLIESIVQQAHQQLN